MKKSTVCLFTDGACQGNPGPGGWGALLRFNETEKKLSGYDPDTTNNRMELMAVIKGLSALKQKCRVEITTDSQYVSRGMTEWITNWRKNNWKNSHNKPVKNADLWKQLDALIQQHEVEWFWVKGHSGHVENELVDELARDAITRNQS